MIRLADNTPEIALGFEDEVWWSRETHPQMHTWSDTEPLRLVEQHGPAGDPERKAIACYALYLPAVSHMLLRFVQGRPTSAVTCAFLAWLAAYFTAQGKRALFLIWENASWHISPAVHAGLKAYNRQAKHTGECRLILCRLPTKSPWLNPIEPRWVQGKRAVAEPARLLSMTELMHRVCASYKCELTDPIAQAEC